MKHKIITQTIYFFYIYSFIMFKQVSTYSSAYTSFINLYVSTSYIIYKYTCIMLLTICVLLMHTFPSIVCTGEGR